MAKYFEEKLRYYELRKIEGFTQKQAAAELGISERTCRRWEREAREQLEQNTESAKRSYSAKLEEKRSVAQALSKLADAITSIDFDNLADAQKLELLLKYGRRWGEIESKSAKMPENVKLSGIEHLDRDTAATEIIRMQTKLYNMAASGEISDELARKKIAQLTELRKSVTVADNW